MRLFGKIFAGVFLCFLFVVLVLSQIVSVALIRESRDSLVERHRFVAEHLAREVATAYRETQWPFESLHWLTQQEEVQFWWVVGDGGQIELADDAAFMGTPAGVYFPSLATDDAPVVFPSERLVGVVRVPLELESGTRVFWLGFSTLRLRQAQRRVALQILVSALAALAALALALYAVVRHFLWPVGALTKGAAALGSGDLSHRLDMSSDDELGQLASAFNQMADELEQRHARLDVLFRAIEQAGEAIVITDPDGTIQYVNPAFEVITGHPADQAIGNNPRVLKSGRHPDAFYQGLWQTITSGGVWRGRFVNRRKDGTLYNEDAVISPVTDAAGEIVNFVAVKRDISRQLTLESQLRQGQKLEAIGTLAGGVAHEINNPINGVINYAQLILDRLPEGNHLSEFAEEIIKEGLRVASIVRNLLQFSRKEQGAVRPAKVADVVGGAVSLFATTTKRDQVRIETDIPDDISSVACRTQQIQQVLMNLLTNARDALNERYTGYDEDKLIRVTAREAHRDGKRCVRISVEDHGAGIPEDIRERLFDPFFTTKSRAERAGLGLAISHGIVRDHGGELTVESEVGEFTRFDLYLPAAGEE